MLGAPCSPCCGGCDTESLRAIYDRIRAATCSVSLSGSLPRQDAAVRFNNAVSAVYANWGYPQVFHNGAWHRWDEFICPSSISSMILTYSGFASSSGTRPAGATVVFSGNSNPSASQNQPRLEVWVTIDVIGSLSGSGDVPTYLGRKYSLIPGTNSCYIWAEAEIRARASAYAGIFQGNTAQAAVSQIGSITLANQMFGNPSYDVYGSRVEAPYYQFVGAQQSYVDVAAGGSFFPQGQNTLLFSGAGSAYWNYDRPVQFGFPPVNGTPSSNTITGLAHMKIYSDESQVVDQNGAMSFSLQSQDQSFGSVSGFWQWRQNTSSSFEWAGSIDTPTLLNPSATQEPYNVRFSYQAADKRYIASPPPRLFVTSASVTLS